jgi:hypothetical protein
MAEQKLLQVECGGGLSKVAHEFGGRSARGGSIRASHSVGTRWAISIIMFFAINFESQENNQSNEVDGHLDLGLFLHIRP